MSTALQRMEMEAYLDRLAAQVFATIPPALQPSTVDRGYMFGREQAYKLFPMDINDIPRGLFTPMRYKLSPPTIHLGYLVSDEKLTDAARHLRCVSWVQKDHPPPPWDESKGPDEQPIHTRLELFIDEFVTKGNVSEVLRDEFGVPQARLTRVCMKNPDESHQLLSLFTSTNEPNHMPSLKDIMSVAEIFGIDDPPAWYPDYMWGDWRARTNEKSFIDPVYRGDLDANIHL